MRFFEESTNKDGAPCLKSRLLGKLFTDPDKACDFVAGKHHRRAVSEALLKLRTHQEKQAAEAKVTAKVERREQRALDKARLKRSSKRKATVAELPSDEIARRKEKFAAKKQRRVERKAAGEGQK